MKTRYLKSIIYIAAILVSSSIMGQKINFEIKNILEIDAYERNQNSTLNDTLDDFGILKNPHFDIETLVQTRTFIYKRNDDDFDPQLHVWYHFDKEWNNLKGKRYHWGLYNPSFNPSENKERLKKLSKNEKRFKAKYILLEAKLKSELGEPINKETIADNENSLVENMFWEDDEKIVGLSMSFSRKLKEIPMIGIFAKFRIEIMITYK